MSFQDMMSDNIKVIKSNGENFDGLKASVQGELIILLGSDILIKTNDLIQRKMSNGGTETFKVIDPGYLEGSGGSDDIPPHYEMKVKKLGVPEAEKEMQPITYHISGSNARVNNSSVDNSTNVVNIDSGIAEHISRLRSEINLSVNAVQEKKEALEIVDVVEREFSTESPSKRVIKTLISALPDAGSIATIGSFLLSALVV